MMHAYVHMHSVAPPQDSAQSKGASLHLTLTLNRRCLFVRQHKKEMAVHGLTLPRVQLVLT